MERPPPRPPWPKNKLPVQGRPARQGVYKTPKSNKNQNPYGIALMNNTFQQMTVIMIISLFEINERIVHLVHFYTIYNECGMPLTIKIETK